MSAKPKPWREERIRRKTEPAKPKFRGKNVFKLARNEDAPSKFDHTHAE